MKLSVFYVVIIFYSKLEINVTNYTIELNDLKLPNGMYFIEKATE